MSQRRDGQPLIAVVAAVVGVLALFGLGDLLALLAGADAGTAPDWIAATATVAAFGAAVVAAWYAHRAFSLERDREDRFVAAQETAQASLVAAWWGVREEEWSAPENERLGGLFPSYGTLDHPGIYLRNASDVPVTDVEVELALLIDGQPAGAPDQTEPLGSQEIDLVPPGAAAVHVSLAPELQDAWDARLEALGSPTDNVRTVVAAVAFTDSRGARWQRTRAGDLRLVN